MRRATLQLIALASSAFVGWLATVAIAAQARPAEKAVDKAPLAEEVFTNVRVLRGIPVDEFMGTMGFFSASLGMSCEDCHGASDTTWENYARDVSPKKATARRMIQMMTSINQTSFGGRAVVTCYTCHRGGAKPKVTPSLALLYGATTTDEADDVVQAAKDAPSVEQILGKYIQAIGGQQRLAAMTTVVGRGSSAGYGPEGTRPIEIFAKAPSQRTMILHTLDGDSTTTYDGRVAWSAVPHKPVPVLMLAGSELDGAKLDAELMFPARIKDTLTGWRAGSPAEIDDKPMQVVQGSRPGGLLATFYFDSESGLLTRLVRYANSRVGRLPTQVDYSDYRDVNGVKVPFHLKITWLDGQEDVTLTDVQVNVPVDAAKFSKPAAPAPK
jgi:photosynthetic reaction center cytochrome c subunit